MKCECEPSTHKIIQSSLADENSEKKIRICEDKRISAFFVHSAWMEFCNGIERREFKTHEQVSVTSALPDMIIFIDLNFHRVSFARPPLALVMLRGYEW
jgi:hypothetical protein